MSRSRRVGRAVGALVLSIVLALCWASPAGAHAVLVSASPGDNARLDDPPADVVLEFNEPVSADLGGLRVFDSTGQRVDRGAVTTSGDTISVELIEPLPDGAYVVSYRIVSADGHPVRGATVFVVGDADVGSADLSSILGDGSDRAWEIAGAVGRWITMAGALVVVGAVALVAWGRPSHNAAVSRAVAVAAGAAVVGSVWSVPVQAALATGQGPGSLFESGVLSSVLADGFGASVALAVVGVVVAAWALWRSVWLALLGSAVAVVSFPVIGHTRVDDVGLGFASDIVHVFAAAVWVGGVVVLLVTRRHGDDVENARVLGRFSSLATLAIVAVGAAGLVLSYTEVKQLSALGSTIYGRVLIAKVALVVLVAAAGAYNHFVLVPAVEASPEAPGPRRRLGRTLRIEAVGFAVVIAATAVLVNVTPAYVDAGIGQIHSEILDLGDAGAVQLVVDPNRAGENSLHLYFYDPDGRPAEIAEDVLIRLSKPGDDIGPIERTPFRVGPAHFQWDGNDLISGGRWEITVVARIDTFSEESATADVLVG